MKIVCKNVLDDKGQTQLGKRFLSTWMSIHIKQKPWHGQAAWADWQSSMIQIYSIVLLQIQSWQQAWLSWKWTDVGMTFAAVLSDTSLLLSELKTRLGLHMGDQYEILGGVLNIWRMSSQSHERMLAYQSKELRPCWSGYQSELDGKVKYEVPEELFGVRQCRSTVSYRSVLVHKEPESLTNPWPVAVQNESETLLHDQIWIRMLHLPFLCQIGTMVGCEWKHQGDRSDNGGAIDNDSRYDVNGFSISFKPTTHFPSFCDCVRSSVNDVGLAWVAIAGSL